MRILIAEDDAIIGMLLTDSLEEDGHEVMGPAAEAAEALEMCAMRRPDLAILDINLRDGRTGERLARVLFERWRLPVILASAWISQAQDVAFGYIRKPYKPATVLAAVEAVRAVMNGRKPLAIPAGFELFDHDKQ